LHFSTLIRTITFSFTVTRPFLSYSPLRYCSFDHTERQAPVFPIARSPCSLLSACHHVTAVSFWRYLNIRECQDFASALVTDDNRQYVLLGYKALYLTFEPQPFEAIQRYNFQSSRYPKRTSQALKMATLRLLEMLGFSHPAISKYYLSYKYMVLKLQIEVTQTYEIIRNV
jgi:hypothetical protein